VEIAVREPPSAEMWHLFVSKYSRKGGPHSLSESIWTSLWCIDRNVCVCVCVQVNSEQVGLESLAVAGERHGRVCVCVC